jgi:nucleotide-binding universal stress UspA family protein
MLTIQILGIGCKKSRALKANLQAALELLAVDVPVKEVVAVEDIIRYPISATPALLVGEDVISEGYVPAVREIHQILTRRYFSNITMKNILVPTDFSNTAANAFRFALGLVNGQESNVSVLHVYHPYFDPENPLDGSDNQAQEEATRKRLEAFIGENTSPSAPEGKAIDLDTVKLHKKIIFGFAADEVVAQSKNYELIVMGTTGDGDLIEQLFGSVSSHVARHAECPVLLVPPDATFEGFAAVVYASDNESRDRALFQNIAKKLQLKETDIHFVHVEKQADEAFSFTKVKQENLPTDEAAEIKLTSAEVTSNNILRALNEYATAHRADLLIMRARQRNFLENIFHKSVTKQMILQAKMPILVLQSKS